MLEHRRIPWFFTEAERVQIQANVKQVEYEALMAMSDVRLRDTFAKAALPGVIAKCGADNLAEGETREGLFARKSYAIADAMMAERKK